MSIVIDFFTRKQAPLSDSEICAAARARVNDALPPDQFAETIRAQARARAVRTIIGGGTLAKAIDQACKWARCAIHPQTPGAA